MSGNFFCVKERKQIVGRYRFRFRKLAQQPGDVADQWFRIRTLLSEKSQVGGFVPFGKARAFTGDEQGQMKIAGRFLSEGPE
ncbi:MAG: hypothetical protein IJV18_11000 [Acidaminococcaceae bacterium]|nr:hypothetical protein [Acidaminococcaceae bacterium]